MQNELAESLSTTARDSSSYLEDADLMATATLRLSPHAAEAPLVGSRLKLSA